MTVKDIAARLGATADPERSKMIERLRYWTKRNLLTPLHEMNTGTGRWRTYPEQAVYVAAVLNELTEMGVDTGQLSVFTAVINLWHALGPYNVPESASWRQELLDIQQKASVIVAEALSGQKDVFLVLGRGGAATFSYEPLPKFVSGEMIGVVAATRIVVNLTTLFRGLRA